MVVVDPGSTVVVVEVGGTVVVDPGSSVVVVVGLVVVEEDEDVDVVVVGTDVVGDGVEVVGEPADDDVEEPGVVVVVCPGVVVVVVRGGNWGPIGPGDDPPVLYGAPVLSSVVVVPPKTENQGAVDDVDPGSAAVVVGRPEMLSARTSGWRSHTASRRRLTPA